MRVNTNGDGPHKYEWRNLYDEVIGRFGSIAEANQAGLIKEATPEGPSIFLSHIRVDKDTVQNYGDYIKKQGLDIYLDVNDKELEKAVNDRDHEKVTQFIEAGIRRCTDVMIFLSDATRTSWWVPYEIGFAKCAVKQLVCVRLADVKIDDLSFLRIVRPIRTRREFVAYIDEIRENVSEMSYGTAGLQKRAEILVNLLLEGKSENPAAGFHPLDIYMNPE
ncbi:MAG: hypothetical protein JWN25_2107 [Verrucomicrobiales bacterium]|nr:hypothetical protein [Verrucomicrobiales bacterium]